MKDLGELHYYLGLEVWREAGKTMVTQSNYVREILNRFNMSDCKVSTILLEQNVKYAVKMDQRMQKVLCIDTWWEA